VLLLVLQSAPLSCASDLDPAARADGHLDHTTCEYVRPKNLQVRETRTHGCISRAPPSPRPRELLQPTGASRGRERGRVAATRPSTRIHGVDPRPRDPLHHGVDHRILGFCAPLRVSASAAALGSEHRRWISASVLLGTVREALVVQIALRLGEIARPPRSVGEGRRPWWSWCGW
jgi:hypothetical protein